jgi:hypothetical protein
VGVRYKFIVRELLHEGHVDVRLDCFSQDCVGQVRFRLVAYCRSIATAGADLEVVAGVDRNLGDQGVSEVFVLVVAYKNERLGFSVARACCIRSWAPRIRA